MLGAGEAAQHEAIAGEERERRTVDVERAKPRSPARPCAAPIGASRARRSAVPARSSTDAASSSAGALGEPAQGSTSNTVARRSAPAADELCRGASSVSATPWRFTAQRAPGPTRSADAPEALEAADPRAEPAGLELDRVADGERGAEQGPGHDRAEAVPLERAVDEEPRRPPRRGVRAGRRRRDRAERRAHASSPAPVTDVTAHDRRAREGAPGEQARDLLRRERERLVVDEVALREHDDTRGSTPSSSQIAACSRVCGMTPSSAATTSSTRSSPVAPATIVRTKRLVPRHVDDARAAARPRDRGARSRARS